jgi:hypothetical protein
MKACWIWSNAFSASAEVIMWFLPTLLLICYIAFNNLCMLYLLCIPGMKPTSSRYIWSFSYAVEFALPIFYWGFLYLSSLKRLAYNSLFLLLLCPCQILRWV